MITVEFNWLNLMDHKSLVCQFSKDYATWIQDQISKVIDALNSDLGSELT